MCTFDYSLQGRNKTGRKISLCQDCCLKELAANLREHTQKAVIVQPSSNYDAYVFYSFKMLIDGAKHSINRETELKSDKDIMSFLPNNGEKCSCCSNPAIYTWCTLNLFKHYDPYRGSFYINL